jgi:adenylosuccinate lyase
MAGVWSDEGRFKQMLLVEQAATAVLAEGGFVPLEDAEAIQRARVDLPAIREAERRLKHETAAFVEATSKTAGQAGERWFHYGLTSSDVADTALALQLRDAGNLVCDEFLDLLSDLRILAHKHAATPVAARTHGRRAQLSTFGFKLAGWHCELRRSYDRLNEALSGLLIGKLSGPVGTYPVLTPEQERRALLSLGLRPEPFATQIVARDRLASLLTTMAVAAGTFERIATSVRLMAQDEVGELSEFKAPAQQGSSAMPHKSNPVRSERITGLSRVLRAYAVAMLESQALWHERDLSHSSTERVVVPDAFAVFDFVLSELRGVINEMEINEGAARINSLYDERLLSGRILDTLIAHGINRQDAYRATERGLTHSRDIGTPLADAVLLQLSEPVTDGPLVAALQLAADNETTIKRIAALVSRL